MNTALIIDDDLDFSEIFSLMLTEHDIAVWEAASTEEAFEALRKEEHFDIIFCDLHLPFTLGDDVEEYVYSEEVGIRTIGELSWVYRGKIPIVGMSASPELDFQKLKERQPDIPTISKPIKRAELEHVLNTLGSGRSTEMMESTTLLV